jgi:serine/threonine-protein kinase MRCK
MLQDKVDAQEKLKLQDKELKDALGQRKLAMAEYTEVTDRFVFCCIWFDSGHYQIF